MLFDTQIYQDNRREQDKYHLSNHVIICTIDARMGVDAADYIMRARMVEQFPYKSVSFVKIIN